MATRDYQTRVTEARLPPRSSGLFVCASCGTVDLQLISSQAGGHLDIPKAGEPASHAKNIDACVLADKNTASICRNLRILISFLGIVAPYFLRTMSSNLRQAAPFDRLTV